MENKLVRKYLKLDEAKEQQCTIVVTYDNPRNGGYETSIKTTRGNPSQDLLDDICSIITEEYDDGDGNVRVGTYTVNFTRIVEDGDEDYKDVEIQSS